MRYIIPNLALASLLIMGGCMTGDASSVEEGDGFDKASNAQANDTADDRRLARKDATADGEVTAEEVRLQTEEAVRAAEQYAEEQQVEYREALEKRLVAIQQQIDDLREQLDKAPTTLDPGIQELFTNMEKRLAETRKAAGEQKADNKETWDNLRSTADEAAGALEKEAEDLRRKVAGDAAEADDKPRDPSPVPDAKPAEQP